MIEQETGRNRRRFMRTKLRARIKLKHPSVGELIVQTGDISDGGVFIHADGVDLPPIGSEVKVQVQDLPMEAPELDARIVRMEPSGIGLEFILP
jgi:c-di-GMP-binding flagellar brake protein YcgR